MKKIPTKAQVRQELDQQISDYLRRGGAVHQIERGVSGRPDPSEPIRRAPLIHSEQQAPRTYLHDIVAAMDARRSRKSTTGPAVRLSRPRKKIVYDDFGEPLRWHWVDE